MAKKIFRTVLWLFAVILVAAMGAGVWVYTQLNGSLALLDGEIAIAGLQGPVQVKRDALGVVTIEANSRVDVARAMGFVHAQDRFFQMDLLRRAGAGELAELFGGAAVEADKRVRVHRLRTRARKIIETGTDTERAMAQAYADGVNAGLDALGAKPFEYLPLRTDPEPWQLEDSILTGFAMYFDLQDENGSRENTHGVMRELMPEELYEFLNPRRTEWDSPLMSEPTQSPPIPGPEVFQLRGQDIELPEEDLNPEESAMPGSNNWAVAGAHTVHGGAIVANDMHLSLRVPQVWYRMSIRYPGPEGRRAVTGVTLPGAPLLIAGSNERVAWGFTNSYGDWSDLIELEETDGGYLTPEGERPFEVIEERIEVRGGDAVTLEVEETIWGPVIDTDHNGRRRALAWTAHHVSAMNMGLMRMEGASHTEEALAIANTVGMPNQNFVVGDRGGRIGWTIAGPIPRRVGHDGYTPTSWADGTRGWDGWLKPEEYPRIIDPPAGRVWSANNRVADGEALAIIGDGDYDVGARARQIRDGLMNMPQARARDMLAIQLDHRALFLARWQRLLLDLLDNEALAADPRRLEFRRLVASWGACACVESAGYRMVRAFRLFLATQIFDVLTAQCAAADERFDYAAWVSRYEGPLWRLVNEQPAHLLNPTFSTWREQLLAGVDDTLFYFAEMGGTLASHTWGERNTLRIRHPLSRFLPFTAERLDMPADQAPGDWHMPRAQSPSFGASQRFAVSPGREADGYLHMPAGQSGHPLSPFYRNSHAAWLAGEPTPFLPGPTQHRLTLNPGP